METYKIRIETNKAKGMFIEIYGTLAVLEKNYIFSSFDGEYQFELNYVENNTNDYGTDN